MSYRNLHFKISGGSNMQKVQIVMRKSEKFISPSILWILLTFNSIDVNNIVINVYRAQ